jgi:hypothetical protein
MNTRKFSVVLLIPALVVPVLAIDSCVVAHEDSPPRSCPFNQLT